MVSIADKECEGSRVRGSHGVVFPRRDHKVFVFNVWSGQFHPQYRRNGVRDIYAKWTLHPWCRSVTLVVACCVSDVTCKWDRRLTILVMLQIQLFRNCLIFLLR